MVDKLEGVDEAVAEMRKEENAASAVEVGYLGQVVEGGGFQRHMPDNGHAAGVLTASGYRSTRDLGDGVGDEGNWPLSKPRTGAALYTETSLAEVIAWDFVDGLLPKSILGARIWLSWPRGGCSARSMRLGYP